MSESMGLKNERLHEKVYEISLFTIFLLLFLHIVLVICEVLLNQEKPDTSKLIS